MSSSPARTATAYRSLRRRPMSRAERFKLGRSLRKQVPRSALARWKAPANRVDPVEQIKLAHEGRLEWLIPIRVGRMAASPYGFLRGTAGVMAADVAALPATGITPVICGDAHLGNFGFYASPGARSRHRPERFRRSPPGRLGVGPAPPGREHLGRRKAERRERGAVRKRGGFLRRRLSERSAFPRQRAAAAALVPAPGRRPAARDGDRKVAARRDCARGRARAIAHQRPRAAAIHDNAGRTAVHRRRAAADHPRPESRSRSGSPPRWTTI